jgi:hypothetical protein
LIVSILFMLLFGFFVSSFRMGLKWRKYGGFTSPLDSPPFGYPTQGNVNPQPLPSLGVGVCRGQSTWITRLFIAIVIVCNVLFLISQHPRLQNPLWFGIVLQGFTYGSAAIFYGAEGDDSSSN